MTTQEFLNALIIYKSLCQLKHVHSNISSDMFLQDYDGRCEQVFARWATTSSPFRR